MNIMPMSIFMKFGSEKKKAKPTNITLQMTDESLRKPFGIVEDVLAKVDILILLVDFVVLDIKDQKIPILGRPFLTTNHMLVNQEKRELVVRIKMKK